MRTREEVEAALAAHQLMFRVAAGTGNRIGMGAAACMIKVLLWMIADPRGDEVQAIIQNVSSITQAAAERVKTVVH